MHWELQQKLLVLVLMVRVFIFTFFSSKFLREKKCEEMAYPAPSTAGSSKTQHQIVS